LLTMKMKKMMGSARWRRHSVARSSGRTSSIDAPACTRCFVIPVSPTGSTVRHTNTQFGSVMQRLTVHSDDNNVRPHQACVGSEHICSQAWMLWQDCTCGADE